MKKRNKVILASACALTLLVGGLGFAAMNNESSSVTVQAEQKKKNEPTKVTIKQAKELLLQLYSNDKKEDFAKDWSPEKFKTVRRGISHAPESKERTALIKECDDLNFIRGFSEKVKTYLNEGILIDDVSEAQLTSLTTDFEKSLSYNEKIANRSIETFTLVKEQYDGIHVASEKVMGLFSNVEKTELAETVNQEQLDETKAIVESIKNEKAKNELFGTFESAIALFNEKLEAEKESQNSESAPSETAQKDASSSANQEVATNEGNSSPGTEQGNNGSTPTPPPSQGGIEGLIASSPTAQYTDQIVGVVASGSSATVYLFEKNGSQWQTVLSSGGHVGSMGVGSASESVSRTPKGSYSLGFSFGTSNPGTQLPFRAITPNSYWISNVNDPEYNTWQERPGGSNSADEHLIDYPVQYQYGIVINFNNGVGGGSGFFLHVDNGAPTAGCVSVPLGVMTTFMQRIHGGASIINVNSESELANF